MQTIIENIWFNKIEKQQKKKSRAMTMKILRKTFCNDWYANIYFVGFCLRQNTNYLSHANKLKAMCISISLVLNFFKIKATSVRSRLTVRRGSCMFSHENITLTKKEAKVLRTHSGNLFHFKRMEIQLVLIACVCIYIIQVKSELHQQYYL